MHKNKIAFILSITFGVATAYAQTAPTVLSPATGQPALATSDYAIAVGSNSVAGTTQGGGLPMLVISPNWA
jgi:hypothetical protein